MELANKQIYNYAKEKVSIIDLEKEMSEIALSSSDIPIEEVDWSLGFCNDSEDLDTPPKLPTTNALQNSKGATS